MAQSSRSFSAGGIAGPLSSATIEREQVALDSDLRTAVIAQLSTRGGPALSRFADRAQVPSFSSRTFSAASAYRRQCSR
jgi:hypothetical protein